MSRTYSSLNMNQDAETFENITAHQEVTMYKRNDSNSFRATKARSTRPEQAGRAHSNSNRWLTWCVVPVMFALFAGCTGNSNPILSGADELQTQDSRTSEHRATAADADFAASFVSSDCYAKNGDVMRDGKITSADIVALINYAWKGGPAPECLNEGDTNCDGKVNGFDTYLLVKHVFNGWPLENCDPTPATLRQWAATPKANVEVQYHGKQTIITLDADMDIYGLEIGLYGTGKGSVDLASASSMQLFTSLDADYLRVGLVDMNGSTRLNQGSKAVFRIDGTYEVQSAAVIDIQGRVSAASVNTAPTERDEPFSLTER